MLIAPGDLPPQQNLTKFGPAISEAAEPNRCYGERDLATPYVSLV
jgi:hypothetical protein